VVHFLALQSGRWSSNANWFFFEAMQISSCMKHYVPILDGLAFRQARNEKEGNGIVYLANLCVTKYWQNVCYFRPIHFVTNYVHSMTWPWGHKNPEIHFMTDSGHDT
jgi:hypothetical protein